MLSEHQPVPCPYFPTLHCHSGGADRMDHPIISRADFRRSDPPRRRVLASRSELRLRVATRIPAMPQRVVCLIPARNAAQDLPACLDSAARVCDLALALDDGSTDDTRRVLDGASPGPAGADQSRSLRLRRLGRRRQSQPARWKPPPSSSPIGFCRSTPMSASPSRRAAALRQFLETDALPGLRLRLPAHRHARRPEPPPARFQWIYRLF